MADYETWLHGLTAYCRHRGCDEPEDVAQEALIRCLAALRRGQTLSRSYIFRAAASTLTDWRRKRRAQLVDLRERVDGYLDSDLSLAETAADDPLALLTANQAEVAVLTAAGYRDREIGDLLGCSRRAVIRRRFDGRRRARAGSCA